MKTNFKSLFFNKQTISKLNGKEIYGGTDPNFTLHGCPPSYVHCPTMMPDQCPRPTEYQGCHISDVPECHTDFLCETDYC